MLCLAPLLACLTDHHIFDPETTFSHARQSFIEGHLAAAQAEAAAGFKWCLASNSECARRFLILEATVMLWSGSSDELLAFLPVQLPQSHASSSHELDQKSDPEVDRKIDEDIRAAALRANALIHVARLSEAEALLDKSGALCAFNNSSACGEILLARGLLALSRDQFEDAEKSFQATIEISVRNQDSFLAATALLDKASVATQREHFDEAATLYRSAYDVAERLGAKYISQTALSSQGWEYARLGNSEKALQYYSQAEAISSELGDTVGEISSLMQLADLYAETGQLAAAERSDLKALGLAKGLRKESAVAGALMDLAQIYITLGKPERADRYAAEARMTALNSGSAVDLLDCDLLAGRVAMLRHDNPQAVELLQRVANSQDSQRSMKWQAYHSLGNLYESKRDSYSAERSYRMALALIEGTRAGLDEEVSQLTFLENATNIYGDYIHLLVSEGKTQEALEAADWSRARTLQQGLGSIANSGSNAKLRTVSAEVAGAPKLKATEIARRTNSSLLFYWLGEQQSYLWVISPEETRFLTLPPKSALVPVMERYKHAILGLKDPLRAGAGEMAADGSWLYQTLVAPAAKQLRPDRPIMLFVDGEMGQLNFETLLAPLPSPHFWIEDATIVQAPSIRMFAVADHGRRRVARETDTMLLFGDTVPAGSEFRALPMAAREIETVKGYFAGTAKVVQGAKATPAAYLASDPGHFDYIHFVAHGTASRTDPLESAVILSQGGTGDDSYKLYAREIVRHPIDARLVTISACNSSGSKSFAGEGLVGLSWAFLRAGAHNAIGSLWEVSDASTPELMDTLYGQLRRGEPPASALRTAKLSLIHSGGHFSRPFYWAPFQLYAGR